MKYIFDMDDMSDKHNCLPWLLKMKEFLPNLKVNLFTIPNKTSKELLIELLSYDWIELLVHGFDHDDNYECAKMGEQEFKDKILAIEHMAGYKPIFKAPGWQISNDVMMALKGWNWAVAVQYSDGRLLGDVNGPFQPKVVPGLKLYAHKQVVEPFQAIHGHTWDVCGNGPTDLEPLLRNLPKDSEFEFISKYVKKNGKAN